MEKKRKKWMTAAQMGELLGLKKTDRYWLIHKNLFEMKRLSGRIMVDVESFENWYANQVKYHKACGAEPGLELRKRSYSVRDISILLGIHEQTAYDLIRRKGLKTVLVDGWKRVPKEEFDRWFNSQSDYSLHDFTEGAVRMKKKEGRSRSEGEGIQSGNGEGTQSESGNEEGTQNGNKAEDTGNGRNDSGQRHPGYISRQEAAVYAGVSDRMIDRWAAEGHFPQNKIGGRVWIREMKFREWVTSWKATAE